MSVFVYCKYWSMWSRRLWAKNGQYLEMNITSGGLIELDEKIRSHCTPRRRDEYLGPKLPDHVLAKLTDVVGPQFASRLMYHDYLAEISPEQMVECNRKSNGGGVPFEIMKKMLMNGEVSYHTEL